MTRRALAVLTAAALVILATAGTALATGAAPPVTMSADAFVPEGAVHHGELVAVFGDVRIEGTVTGEVVVVMGSLYISGTVESDVVSVLSPTTLTETSVETSRLRSRWAPSSVSSHVAIRAISLSATVGSNSTGSPRPLAS